MTEGVAAVEAGAVTVLVFDPFKQDRQVFFR
jgi:hypothetical protein